MGGLTLHVRQLDCLDGIGGIFFCCVADPSWPRFPEQNVVVVVVVVAGKGIKLSS